VRYEVRIMRNKVEIARKKKRQLKGFFFEFASRNFDFITHNCEFLKILTSFLRIVKYKLTIVSYQANSKGEKRVTFSPSE